jgi:ATP-dependent helicase/nuclease subunit A
MRETRMSNQLLTAPPDQDQRQRALDPSRSVLVQAPAGSGKTDLLTRRFLRLLSEVDDPAQIVAITFTKAAAAEMRQRIVSELEKAEIAETTPRTTPGNDEFSMESLARRALQRSRALNWNLIDLPTQLRVSTIDSFCRELALQQPLLAGLGGGLDIAEQPHQHYRRAARRTLEQVGAEEGVTKSGLQHAIETLLLWRDNNWQDLEGQLVKMLEQRDRWMQDFVIESEQDWEALRERLERPFARAVSDGLARLADLLGQRPGACSEAMELARFACANSEKRPHKELAELAEFPCGPFVDSDEVDDARQAYECLSNFLLTLAGSFRKVVNVSHGFPPDRKREKLRMKNLIEDLASVAGLEDALAAVSKLPPARYTDDDWNIVRACFKLLSHAAAQLKVIFAEAGTVDYVEVAQLAQRVLEDTDGAPTDAAIDIADGIKHLLVDEFQDTSRRQHKLIASVVAAWPDTNERTVFVVGDPMQSIYFFRDADAELFPRVRHLGLDLSRGESLHFEFAPLTSNFRTAPQLVEALNQMFASVFAIDDGSRLQFSGSRPVRSSASGTGSQLSLHLGFVPQTVRASTSDPASLQEKEEAAKTREVAQAAQTDEIVSLIRSHIERMERAHALGEKYRVAILGRTRTALAPIARALRNAAISFRAVDLEPLVERPEVLDVLALARALFNGEDRVAWLGVLRAPWCGLSLKDLHTLTSGDHAELLRTGVPEVFSQRVNLLSREGQRAVNRVVAAIEKARLLRLAVPTASIGTWLKQVWEQLGGAACVDATALTNLGLLWRCLDALPGGEPDLLGNALSTALEKLTAQPDPAVNSECGVQLMTIHKSKGLEFELVIVPELHAGCNRTTGGMLTWLERGVAGPDDSGAITEFLIAPIQPKGSDQGVAKAWVDKAYRQREHQEIRRILYVAATRAREELHMFARPEYKEDKNGELILCEPSESLLSAAWPALEDEVREKFDAWTRQQIASESVSLAAAGESNLIEMPSLSAPIGMPAQVRRLPLDYEPPPTREWRGSRHVDGAGNRTVTLYTRHEGGMASRALGSAVHLFFEELARLRITLDWRATREAVAGFTPRVTSRIRLSGIVPQEAEKIAEHAFGLALRASHDPVAEWILSPHPHADREARWTGMIAGSLRTVQADVVFRGGNSPESLGDDSWWIIDYKTSQAENTDPEQAMREMRPLFAPQLEIYAQVLRNLHGDGARIHAGLYYPRMLRFDWWEI